MRKPIFVRDVTEPEQQALKRSLRATDSFVVRRCQIILGSARGERAPALARQLGCDDETVRDVIRAFNQSGLTVLTRRSKRPHTIVPAFSPGAAERLRAILHQSPRTFGKARSLWTLGVVAEVSYEQGLTASRVSGETVRTTLQRLGLSWTRAKHWITSPDPAYVRKKRSGAIDPVGQHSTGLGARL